MYYLRLFNKNVLIFILADGFYYGGYGVLNAFLSVLITAKITAGRVDIASYVIAYYLILRAIAELPFSNYVRHLSDKRRVQLVSSLYLLYGFLVLAMGFSTMIWQIFALQTFIALIDAFSYPIRWPMFTRILDRGNEELEWGIEDVVSTLLPALFSALAGLSAEAWGVASAFYIFGPVFMISGLCFSFMDLSKHPRRPKTPKDAREALLWIVTELRAVKAKFEISGGLAAELQGSRRPLADIDIDVHEKTLKKLLPRVSEHVIFGPARYQDKQWDLYMMTLRYKTQLIDICGVEHTKIYDRKERNWMPLVNDFSKRNTRELFGLRLPVSTREELIAYKSKLKRLVDNIDVAQLQSPEASSGIHIYNEPAGEPAIR